MLFSVVKVTALFWFGAALLSASPVKVQKLLHVRVPMRDGVHLDTNVFHPPWFRRYPVILIRTPYGKGVRFPTRLSVLSSITAIAVVMQDVRGRYASEGVFDALNQEGPDGYDTLNWIAAQPWSDGKIGMIGGSYLGIAQWQVALLNNPHLKAIFPVVSGSRTTIVDRFYSPGGAMKLGHRLLWLSQNLTAPGIGKPKFGDYIGHLPLRTSDRAATRRTLPIYQTIVNHPTYDSFWKDRSVRENISACTCRCLRWAAGTTTTWRAIWKRSRRCTSHGRHDAEPPHHDRAVAAQHVEPVSRALPYGDDSSSPIRAIKSSGSIIGSRERRKRRSASRPGAWHPLRAEVDEAPVHIFVMGVNRWRDEPDWPLARTHYHASLSGERRPRQQLKGDGVLNWSMAKKGKPDQFTYDPRNPVPTRAARCAAIRRFFRGGRWISAPWRSARTCWFTPASR